MKSTKQANAKLGLRVDASDNTTHGGARHDSGVQNAAVMWIDWMRLVIHGRCNPKTKACSASVLVNAIVRAAAALACAAR